MIREIMLEMDWRNRIKLFYHLSLTALHKYFNIRPHRFILLELAGFTYEVETGMGELKILYENNIMKVYTRQTGFLPDNGMVCIDIGSNIGSTSIEWSRTNAGGKIYALEPHPQTYKKLEENISLNDLEASILPRQIAISDSDGELELFLADGGTMAMKPNDAGDRWTGEKVTLPSLMLDTFIEQEKISSVDILKIDIEGFEVDALRGATRTLQITRKIVLEYHSDILRKECLEILSSAGFEVQEKETLLFGNRDL